MIDIEVLPGISDHEIVSVITSIVPRILKQSRQKIYLYNKTQWEMIRRELEPMVTSLLSCNNVNVMWEEYCLLFRDKYVLCKIAKSCCSLPWLTMQ